MSSPIEGIQSAQSALDAASHLTSGGAQNDGGEFMKTLKDAMSEVEDLQTQADTRVGQLLTGNSQDVHTAMIAVEKAGLAFAMMVSVRNKIVAAYTQVSGLQF